jgi:histidinol-phosphate phosphatase family protein
MIKPSQAVVFCGGLGSRLRPLTDNLPKPMAPILDKPFLEYLLQQLSDQGIKRFVLLAGYLSEIIQEYFGDGGNWGWEIQYSIGPVEWDTGRRLWESREFLDENFLLLYADNFSQFNLVKLIDLHTKQEATLTFLVAKKNNGNIRISSGGQIEDYDKDRQRQGLDFVEIGYMFVERDLVFSIYDNIPNMPDISFSAIIEVLVKRKQVSGLVINESYHSISDVDRLELTRKYLMPKKIILIDRDGVINVKAPRGEYIETWGAFEWIDDTVQSMKQLSCDGFSFVVITNQAGVSRGMVSELELNKIHYRMVEELKQKNINLLGVYACLHHWNENCGCRKPRAGLFHRIAEDYCLRMDQTLYIGDDLRDCEAAYNAGCGSVLLGHSKEYEEIKCKPHWSINVEALSDAIPDIKVFMGEWN